MATESTVGTWQKEFFQNKTIFMENGMSEAEAEAILKKFLYYCSVTPLPRVMETFEDPEKLNDVGVYTPPDNESQQFMLKFLEPILKNFTVEGAENLKLITPYLGKFPITVVSNHLSHLDAPAIFYCLYQAGPEGRKLAESLTFIAGRLAFLPEFTRLGLYMFGTLLVCSQKDLSNNLSKADVMTKINMRAFRHSQQLASEGKTLAIFPEGTRSRSGRLEPFVDSVYHYVANKIVLPISLEGSEQVLPTQSYLFNASQGKLTIGRPLIVGRVKGSDQLPDTFDHLPLPKKGDKKKFIIDNLALIIGKGLHQHRHGTYRNLYKGDGVAPTQHELIKKPPHPREKIVVLGHSQMGTAIATAMANKDVEIQIFMRDAERAAECDQAHCDLDYFPMFRLPPNISFTSEPEVFDDATLFIQAESPWLISELLGDVFEGIKRSRAPIVNVAKGLSSTGKGLVLSDLQDVFGIADHRLACIGGAVIPFQLMERKISGQEMAACDPDLLEDLLPIFNTGYLYTRRALNPVDVVGVQLGSALKTMYALGVGLLDGYFEQALGGKSDNTIFHITNLFFRELKMVGVSLGAHEETFDGLSGITDFMLSCFGGFNQDRQYGFEFAQGNKDPHPTHGLYSLRLLPNILDMSGADFPILKSIYQVIVRGANIDQVITTMQQKLLYG